ncbi:hypothetical protein V8C37DRAFT_390974 [Trichoderma ceciliae]
MRNLVYLSIVVVAPALPSCVSAHSFFHSSARATRNLYYTARSFLSRDAFLPKDRVPGERDPTPYSPWKGVGRAFRAKH